MFLFINGIDARLRNAVLSFLHENHNRDMGALLEAAEREVSKIRAILGSSPRRKLLATPRGKKNIVIKRSESLVAIAALIDVVVNSHNEDLFHQDGYSFPTAELAS